MATTRRGLMAAALAVSGVYGTFHFGAPWIASRLAGDFEFEPLAAPQGFRRLKAGRSTAGFDPFVGLQAEPSDTQATLARVQSDVCGALFAGTTEAPGILRIASFSDYYCPYCRVLTQRLARLQETSGGAVRISWHELPLLGTSSMTAAKGALAADLQQAYPAFHRRLMRAPFQSTPDYLHALAAEIGIDAARLAQDMESDTVRSRIADSAALARLFGLVGIPAMVVGRTLVQGEINEATLARLIAHEAQDGPMAACA